MSFSLSSAEGAVTAPQWDLIPLGEVVEVLDSRRKPITKKDRKSGPYPYYGATGVVDWVDDYLFDEELVLVGEDGAKWGPGEQSAFAISGKAWVNNHAHVLKPDRERITDAWLIYFLNAADLSGFITGLTVPKLNQGRLREIPVPLPSVDEQQRIVAILDQAFAALDRARGHAMVNLGDTFTLFDSAADKLSRAQNVGWEVGTFGGLVGEVFTGPFGSLLHKKDYVEDGVPIVNPSNIVEGRIEPDWSKTVSPDAAERLRAYTLREGDLVIGRRGEMGRCAPVSAEADGWLCGTGSFFLRPNPNVSTELVAYLMRTPTLVGRLTGIATGATMLNLSNRALTQMPFELPAYDTQLDLLDKLKALEARTSALRSGITAKLSDIAALRQSLLQQAFSGQLT